MDNENQDEYEKFDVNKIVAIIIGALVIIILFIQIAKVLSKKTVKTNEQASSSASQITPAENIPLPKPSISIQKFPFSRSDKTRKIEIVGCVKPSVESGYTYSKMVVEIPNTTNYVSETMKVFLEQSALVGWGGFPSKEEVIRFEELKRKATPGFNYKYDEVKLLGLTYDKTGYTRINFSKEVEAYGGGAARVGCIADSVAMTLQQFPEVKFISLCIENECTDQKGAIVFQP